jgi:hypothetical protein
MHQVIVLGDLNETRTVHDRLPLRQPASLSATAQHEQRFVDRLERRIGN